VLPDPRVTPDCCGADGSAKVVLCRLVTARATVAASTQAATHTCASARHALSFSDGHRGPVADTARTLGAAGPQRHISLMKSEQRSPIMTAGAWVLPRTIVGMIDVSAMRRPSTPCTRNFGSTTPSVADPIRAVHDG
jgi:hypothetical protein